MIPRLGSASNGLFISGVTAEAKIIFKGIPPSARSIKVLSVSGYISGDSFTVAFRDVPLDKAARTGVPMPGLD
jgi:hypothetical protein